MSVKSKIIYRDVLVISFLSLDVGFRKNLKYNPSIQQQGFIGIQEGFFVYLESEMSGIPDVSIRRNIWKEISIVGFESSRHIFHLCFSLILPV